jgi:transposase, IS30 family
MKKHTQLGKAERLEIAILLGKGYSLRSIAGVLGRSPNTISYEVGTNGVNGIYDPHKAHAKARLRKRRAKFQRKKINHDEALRQYITRGLQKHWNPEEISGRMKVENLPFCASKTTIYEWLYSVYGQVYCQYLYTHRYQKKRRAKKTKREMIPERVGIEARPVEATLRIQAGHFEGDTIVSRKGGSGGLSVLQDRKTRVVGVRKLSSLSPTENRQALQILQKDFRIRSITFDNGIENKQHMKLGVSTFFCHPYSSWEKGSVENANKMLRRYFPKGTDFKEVSEKHIQAAVHMINEKPRKILGFRTALEAARAEGILCRESN